MHPDKSNARRATVLVVLALLISLGVNHEPHDWKTWVTVALLTGVLAWRALVFARRA